MGRRLLLLLPTLLAATAAIGVSRPAAAAGDPGPVHPIVFPVIGRVTFTDTYGDPRSGGRVHQGQDLMGNKHQELVATAAGTITYLTSTGAVAGNMVELTADDGWVYSYVHLNNDTPGTDDGAAERKDVFGPGIERGARVAAGQLLGYLGDSGNAEETAPHLHFEMKDPTGQRVNPYASLQSAQRVGAAEGAPTSPIPRLAGLDRVATAVAASKAGWPEGAPDVVLAAGDRYAEALPATVLAAARSGPLLLSVGDTPAQIVLDELSRLRAQRVTVVGSVSESVATAIAKTGVTMTRLGGPDDPTATAVEVAKAVGGGAGVAVVVNMTRFADGVSATAVAAGRGWPVLLTTATTVPQKTVDAWRALGVKRLVLVGGTAVINEKIEAFARDAGRCGGAASCEVERLAGSDRYATSVAVVRRSLELGGRSASTLLLGTGTAYPDALASGPLASRLGGLALLVDGSGAGSDSASRSFLSSHAGTVQKVSILGGSGAVNAAADRAIQTALGMN